MKSTEVLPDGQDQLVRDGVVIRKGTVGAFLVNAKAWADAAPGSAERLSIEMDMVEALPALRAMGLFDVLSIKDESLRQWIESK